MKFLKSVLIFIREIDLTAIGKTFLTGFGWGARFLGGIAMRIVEKVIDKQIKKGEDNLDVSIKDQEIEARAKANADKIAGTTTDEDLDNAFRDSLK
jgi:hypothetical protein